MGITVVVKIIGGHLGHGSDAALSTGTTAIFHGRDHAVEQAIELRDCNLGTQRIGELARKSGGEGVTMMRILTICLT